MKKPNILWICADQQRWDTLGCLGATAVDTPHIDGLAQAGVAFRRAYTQSPICTPSRASFLTGTYPICNQVHRNGNDAFPGHLALVPKIFSEAGYRTGLIGKLHLSAAKQRVEQRTDDGYDEFYWSHHPNPDWPAGHDYQEWLKAKGVDPAALYAGAQTDEIVYDGVPTEYQQTAWAADRAKDFMARHRDRPWLLSINLYDPHPPFDPPREYLDRIDPARVPPAIFRPSDLAHFDRITGVDQQSWHAVDPTQPFDPTLPVIPPGHDRPPSNYDIQRCRRAYFAMVALIDDMVGDLLATLDATGQRNDTLVIFMSDHGEMLGDHGLIYKGARFYEGLVHVPLVISYPAAFRRNASSDALVELVDLPATLLEAAGLAVPHQNQGMSLVPLLQGQRNGDVHKPYVLSEYFDALGNPWAVGSRASMFFDGRYKMNVYHDAGVGEIFDLREDPQEFNDLWDDTSRRDLKLELMTKHFAAFMKVSGSGPPRVADY